MKAEVPLDEGSQKVFRDPRFGLFEGKDSGFLRKGKRDSGLLL